MSGHVGIVKLMFAAAMPFEVTRGYIGIMEKKMETTIVYWGYIGIMETTISLDAVHPMGLKSIDVFCFPRARVWYKF